MSRAVGTSLYIKLVNDPALYSRYASHFGGRGVEWLTKSELNRPPLEIDIIECMIGGKPRFRPMNVADARLPSFKRITASSGTALIPILDGPVMFVLHGVRFLKFVEPLLRLLPPSMAVVASTTPDLAAPLNRAGILQADQLYGPGQERLIKGKLGRGLAGMENLPASYEAILKSLKQFEPRTVVLIEGMTPFDEVTHLAARRLGIPTLCLQQGWSPFIHNGFRHMQYSKMAVWGVGFQQLLDPYNPDLEFVITGSMLTDEHQPGSALATVVGSRPAISFFVQGPSQVITESHLSDFEQLILTASEQFPDAALIVREHPAAPLSPESLDRLRCASNVILAPSSAFTLREVLEVARLSVSIYSTVLLESAALGVPALVFNPTSMPRYHPDLELQGVGFECRESKHALEIIGAAASRDSFTEQFRGMASFQDTFFDGSEGSAAQRIVEAMLNPGDLIRTDSLPSRTTQKPEPDE